MPNKYSTISLTRRLHFSSPNFFVSHPFFPFHVFSLFFLFRIENKPLVILIGFTRRLSFPCMWFFVLEFPVFLSKTGRLRIDQPLINSRLRKGTGESALYLELMGADSQCSKIFINHLGPQNTFQHDSVEPNWLLKATKSFASQKFVHRTKYCKTHGYNLC